MSRYSGKTEPITHWTYPFCVEVETTDQDIRDKYKELFNGVGLLKGYELKLNS